MPTPEPIPSSTDEILQHLADELLINHYNVSLAKSNSGQEQDIPGFKKIFGDRLKYHGFSRNILVIGAGASKNAFSFFNVVSSILPELCKRELHLDKVFENSKVIWNRFREEACKLLKHSFTNKEFEPKFLKHIFDRLNFEDSLKLLSTVVTNAELSAALKRSLFGNAININEEESLLNITDYLPSLFYEIIAHLFKHRYIDVIVNMNFDEMLDSAIEDEMGQSTYYKIVSDADCIRLGEVIDDKRLRIPIYIKPHGTLKSVSSMRYTTDSYLTHPKEMSLLLKEIFSGKVSESENLEYKNIIFVGYSFSDLDIQTIIFSDLIKTVLKAHLTVSKTTFFVFASNKVKYFQDFERNFWKWFENDALRVDRVNKQTKPTIILEAFKERILFVESNINNDFDYSSSLGDLFLKLYKVIQSKFEPGPFAVKDLTRHELLAQFFSRQEIINNIQNIVENPGKFYKKRAIFNCLYSFIKYCGKIPLNELLENRTGKYQLLYFNDERAKNSVKGDYQNLIIYLAEILAPLKSKGVEIVTQDSFVICKNFKQNLENILRILLHQMEINSYPSKTLLGKVGLHDTVYLKFRNLVLGKGVKEINVMYNNERHGRFFPFKQESIISTNLALTWKYFDYAVNRRDWSILCQIGDTGRPIFNLHSKADNEKCYLQQIKDAGQKVFLLHTIDNPTAPSRENDYKEEEIIIEIGKILGNEEQFWEERIGEEQTGNKLALFLDQSLKPLRAIYYFKSSAQARINPVSFDLDNNENNNYVKQNLQLLWQMFQERMPDEWLSCMTQKIHT